MEKVQQAERGLQSCLELCFLAKLPKAISPKEGLEKAAAAATAPAAAAAVAAAAAAT